MKSTIQPYFRNVGVIALPYHDWNEYWKTPHHVLVRLARYFRVVWVHNVPEWREALSQTRALSTASFPEPPWPGFQVYYPERWLPIFHRPKWLAEFTFNERLRRARRILTAQGCDRFILHLWHPQFGRALSSIPHTISCYHIDDEYSFSSVEMPPDENEIRIMKSVDQVFMISPGLIEKKGKINPHTAFAPEGVDYRAYATPVAEPSDMRAIPHPRVGYTGVLKKQLDWPLLLSLATKHPEWSFVFVGYQAPHPEVEDYIRQMSTQRNVYFLGGKSVNELAHYPQHFDVCIMPYGLDDYTKYIYPLKLHEYLAGGKPIVGTPIRSLLDFTHVMMLASTSEEWSEALTESLAPDQVSIDHIEKRRSVARQFDWEVLVHDVARSMCNRLGSPYKEQFSTITLAPL
ncbi:MAG: glycosyltransferase [Nitrospira sp.]|nr:glycosyltransferase [Nitrospira sp.]